jgi:hypothetical protein
MKKVLLTAPYLLAPLIPVALLLPVAKEELYPHRLNGFILLLLTVATWELTNLLAQNLRSTAAEKLPRLKLLGLLLSASCFLFTIHRSKQLLAYVDGGLSLIIAIGGFLSARRFYRRRGAFGPALTCTALAQCGIIATGITAMFGHWPWGPILLGSSYSLLVAALDIHSLYPHPWPPQIRKQWSVLTIAGSALFPLLCIISNRPVIYLLSYGVIAYGLPLATKTRLYNYDPTPGQSAALCYLYLAIFSLISILQS